MLFQLIASGVERNCLLIKEDCLAACISLRVVGAVFVVGVVNLHNHPANGKQGPIPEEIYPSPADQ